MIHKSQLKALTSLIAVALFVVGCTKTRDARLSDSEELATFAIADFGTVQDDAGFDVAAKPSPRENSLNAYTALESKGMLALDSEDSTIPKRLRFMLVDLEVAGQSSEKLKIVFGVDAKNVTAYKVAHDLNSLTSLEKLVAVSPAEVQTSIDMQKSGNSAEIKSLATKLKTAQEARRSAIANNRASKVLVPIFKYSIKTKGILERTKNELREETSNLTLRETEFSRATHIRIGLTSDDREDIGGADQATELSQIYSMSAVDNNFTTAGALQAQLKVNMQFVPAETKVLTRLDAKDMKVYEMIDKSALTADELRLFQTGSANGEILACKDHAAVQSTAESCVLRLVASVPVTYKRASLTLIDGKENSSNRILLEKVTKGQSVGLVEIARDTIADRARPNGLMDPMKTIRISDLSGDFYFRRTFEDSSNLLTIGKAGTSGDLSVIRFELERDRLVVRNQKALIQYIGQGPKDREELMSLPVKYFKLDRKAADGAELQVPQLVTAVKEDAEYIEIDWRASTIPVSNSPLAYYSSGRCLQAEASQEVTNMDMRLATDGVLNFSLAGSYTLNPSCVTPASTNSAYFSVEAQFNYNLSERISFRRVKDATESVQFAPNVSPQMQSAFNFAIFTLADLKTGPEIRQGRAGSQIYKPVIHDFRNGKTMTYHIGGLSDVSAERRELIVSAAVEVVQQWNEAFRKAFAGTENARSGDYIILNTESANQKLHIGDLDKNFLWFMDKETENGLLGVAQPGPNPYSGTIVHNNVIVYTGNSESSVRQEIIHAQEVAAYENLLKEAKEAALADLKAQQEAEQPATTSGLNASVQQPAASAPAQDGASKVVTDAAINTNNYLQRLVLSTRPTQMDRMSSQWASLKAANNRKVVPRAQMKGRTVIGEGKITTDKFSTRRILEQAFSGELQDDPLLMEALIAREMARAEPGLSQQMKDLLQAQANAKLMSAEFDFAAKKRGGCFMYTREHYGNKILTEKFEDIFKREVMTTLSHEIGHALGLIHNFKASYDKENFLYEGEKVEEVDRNYSSVMDYMAPSEQAFQGPGPYDVHALRAIYTGRIEVSEPVKDMMAQKKTTTLKVTQKGSEVAVKNGFVNLMEVQGLLNMAYSTDLRKESVNDLKIFKYYGQCDDSQVGIEPACTRYDSGASATDIVKNTIQNYNRRYMVSYRANDRIEFNFSNKVAVVRRAISDFQVIRGHLDDMFRMAIYNNAVSQEEFNDFLNASQIGYNFFHELIRTPDLKIPYGKTPEQIKRRFIPLVYERQIPAMVEDATTKKMVQAMKDGKPVFEKQPTVRIIESKPTFDAMQTTDRLATLGIGYDKAFALDFLLTANPSQMTDDSQTGWISYNEYEQYFKGVESAKESQNMLTMLEIMTGTLSAGFIDDSNVMRNVNLPATDVNRMMLDNAILSSLINTNAYRTVGLDTFAEFFKVGTLKGGRNITDRPTAARLGQSSTSQVGVKFYSPDSALGSAVFVEDASRKGHLLEYKAQIYDVLRKMLTAEAQFQKGLAAAKAREENKGIEDSILINRNEELKQLKAVAALQFQGLKTLLNEINKSGHLATAEEIKANPNLAIDKQAIMLRGMVLTSYQFFSILKTNLPRVPQQQLAQVFERIEETKKQFVQLASVMDVLALGQEFVMDTFSTGTIDVLNDDGAVKQVPARNVVSLIVGEGLTSRQDQLMYTIESLATYTRMLSPEYSVD